MIVNNLNLLSKPDSNLLIEDLLRPFKININYLPKAIRELFDHQEKMSNVLRRRVGEIEVEKISQENRHGTLMRFVKIKNQKKCVIFAFIKIYLNELNPEITRRLLDPEEKKPFGIILEEQRIKTKGEVKEFYRINPPYNKFLARSDFNLEKVIWGRKNLMYYSLGTRPIAEVFEFYQENS